MSRRTRVFFLISAVAGLLSAPAVGIPGILLGVAGAGFGVAALVLLINDGGAR